MSNLNPRILAENYTKSAELYVEINCKWHKVLTILSAKKINFDKTKKQVFFGILWNV